jgi:hypothetical protein
MPDTAPLKRSVTVEQEPVAILATGTNSLRAPFNGTVSKVTYTPLANVTGAASPASRTLSVINHKQDGTGTTVVGQLSLVAGTNLVAFDEKSLGLSATASDLVVAEGDILEFRSAPVGGTGLVDPGGTVSVEFSRG